MLFLDEPTASLDPAATKLVEEIITRVADGGRQDRDVDARSWAGAPAWRARSCSSPRSASSSMTPADRFFTKPASEEARRFLAGDLVI